MAKLSSPKKALKKFAVKTPVSFSKKSPLKTEPFLNGFSKYEPGNNTDRHGSSLANDGCLLKFYIDSVKGFCWEENDFIKVLPKMVKAASTKTIYSGIHTDGQMETHVERLPQLLK
jgi:hypothetical protein